MFDRVVLLEQAVWNVQRLEALVDAREGDAEAQERDRWELLVACQHAKLLACNQEILRYASNIRKNASERSSSRSAQ